MKSVHSCREETLWQTFCPTSRSRCIFKNSDSCRHKVCDFMRLNAIACDRMRSHAISSDRMRSHADRCDIAHKRLTLTKNLFQRGSGSKSNSILPEKGIIRDRMRSHANPCDLMRSHAIACDRMRSRKKTLCRQLSEFLKMHREREAGQKVCLKCFFTTTVNRFHYYFFSPFSKRKK